MEKFFFVFVFCFRYKITQLFANQQIKGLFLFSVNNSGYNDFYS